MLQRDSPLDHFVSLWFFFRCHGHVDVGSQYQRHPPVGHGAFGVEACRLSERSTGFGVVKSIGQHEPLIDEELCSFRAGRDWKLVVSKILKPRSNLARDYG